MNDNLICKTNLFGAWCGVFYCLSLLIGWWVVGGYFPLHKPSAGAAEIAAFYAPENVGHIRAGLVIVMWGAMLFLPFTVTMADYVARIEGRPGPLTRLMTLSGYSNGLLTFLPPIFWLVAAFRPDARDGTDLAAQRHRLADVHRRHRAGDADVPRARHHDTAR